MLPEIIDAIAQHFVLRRTTLNYVLLGGGNYRDPKHYRCAAIIFNDTKPLYLARWYPSGASFAREASSMQEFSKCGIAVPSILGELKVNGVEVLVEEYINGISLHEMLERRLVRRDEALLLASSYFSKLLAKSRRESTFADISSEISKLIEPLKAAENAPSALLSVLDETAEVVLDYLSQSHAVITSLCHFDFVLKNMLYVDNRIFLIDFEFSRRSHLWFYDWFRLFRYSSALTPAMLRHSELPEALHELISDARTFRAVRVISILVDHALEMQVFPSYKHVLLNTKLLHNLMHEAGGLIVVAPSSIAESKETKSAEYQQIDLRSELLQAEAKAEVLSNDVRVLKDTVSALEKQKNELDSAIQGLLNSRAFRIGKLVTGTLKRVPGMKHISRS